VRTRADGKHEGCAAGRRGSTAAGPCNLLFFSGMLPVIDHKLKFIGRLGIELDAEAGRQAAYVAALNVLAAAREHLGSLDRVTRVVRLGVFMAASGDFLDQPRVADAASDLFRDVFGIEKASVRLVIGVASLPLGMPIGLDVIFEVADLQKEKSD
jgi:enamine deaminase RidA (YjgF/YER057c/UK114 family)